MKLKNFLLPRHYIQSLPEHKLCWYLLALPLVFLLVFILTGLMLDGDAILHDAATIFSPSLETLRGNPDASTIIFFVIRGLLFLLITAFVLLPLVFSYILHHIFRIFKKSIATKKILNIIWYAFAFSQGVRMVFGTILLLVFFFITSITPSAENLLPGTYDDGLFKLFIALFINVIFYGIFIYGIKISLTRIPTDASSSIQT